MQSMKQVLGHADHTVPIRQHGVLVGPVDHDLLLDPVDRIVTRGLSALKNLDDQMGSDPSEA